MNEQDNEKEDEQDSKEEVKLADYFVVALEMLEFEEKGEHIWFSKLVESLSGTFSRNEVAKSLNTLEDWLLVSKKYGETSPDHAGMLYYLTEEGKSKMVEIRDAYIPKTVLSKLSKDILVLICEAHKQGKEAISSDEIHESLKKNRDRYREEGVKVALNYLYEKGYVCDGIGGDGYSLKPMAGQVTC